jgi:hypothetical protein
MSKKSLARVRTEIVSDKILGGSRKTTAVATKPPEDFALVSKADLEALGKALRALRWPDQGGYPGLWKGKWSHTSMVKLDPSATEAAFRLAGIVPDEIAALGLCADCEHAIDGREQGYQGPCLTCKRPKMSNFVPASKLKRKAA